MIVTQENFWEARKEFEKERRSAAWGCMQARFGVGLALTIIYRSLASYIVIPASFLFSLFLLTCYTEGAIETINAMFIGNTITATSQDIKVLNQVWHITAFFSFIGSWIMMPWKSPIQRQVEEDLHWWWDKHGDKLPGLKPTANT